MGLLIVCSKNICPSTVDIYIFHINLMGFKISENFVIIHIELHGISSFLRSCLSVCLSVTQLRKSLPFIIPAVHCHVHKSPSLELYTARSIQSAIYAIPFNLILPPVPLTPDVLILSISQSKSANISELHSRIKRTQN